MYNINEAVIMTGEFVEENQVEQSKVNNLGRYNLLSFIIELIKKNHETYTTFSNFSQIICYGKQVFYAWFVENC